MRVSVGNQLLFLSAAIHEGGESCVFEHPTDSDLLIKIWKEGRGNPDKAIHACKHRPSCFDAKRIRLAWPLEPVLDTASQTVIGFVMPRIHDSISLGHLADAHERLRKIDIHFLVRAARSLAAQIASLHSEGYVIGDLHLENVLVLRTGETVLIDLDSVQIRKPDGQVFHCDVGVPEYQPPQYQEISSYDNLVRSRWDDCWAAAVIFFKIVLGEHPFNFHYAGDDEPPTISDLIRDGIWPWSGKNPAYAPPRGAPDLMGFPDEIKELFFKTFEDGAHQPNSRSTMDMWVVGLAPHDDPKAYPSRRVWRKQQAICSGEPDATWNWHFPLPRISLRAAVIAATAASLVASALFVGARFIWAPSARSIEHESLILSSDGNGAKRDIDPYFFEPFVELRKAKPVRSGDKPIIFKHVFNKER